MHLSDIEIFPSVLLNKHNVELTGPRCLRVLWSGWCTPGTGVNLWGVSPLCVNPVNVFKPLAQILAEGKGGTVRDRLEEASGKAMSRRTETAYKAQSPGKSAQHDEAPDSGVRVNAAVV